MQSVRKVAIYPVILGISLLIRADAAGAQTDIYRCPGTNGVVYSDRPCDDRADPHEIDNSRITVYTPLKITPEPPAGPASATAPTRQPKKRRVRSGPDPGDHRSKCARLDQRLRDVRTKMRTGYGVEEGERLRARQRQLNEQRRTEKCG